MTICCSATAERGTMREVSGVVEEHFVGHGLPVRAILAVPIPMRAEQHLGEAVPVSPGLFEPTRNRRRNEHFSHAR